MARIVVMHTNKFLRLLHLVELNRDGFEVLLAKDGHEAVKEIQESAPDLLVIAAPRSRTAGMAELVRVLRQNTSLPFILQASPPVIDSGVWPREIFARQQYDLSRLKAIIRKVLKSGLTEKQRNRFLDAFESVSKSLESRGA